MRNKKYAVCLGGAIRSKRKEMGISQDDFAELCGLHRTYIGSVERGERNISLNNIVEIARALKVSAADLMALARL